MKQLCRFNHTIDNQLMSSSRHIIYLLPEQKDILYYHFVSSQITRLSQVHHNQPNKSLALEFQFDLFMAKSRDQNNSTEWSKLAQWYLNEELHDDYLSQNKDDNIFNNAHLSAVIFPKLD